MTPLRRPRKGAPALQPILMPKATFLHPRLAPAFALAIALLAPAQGACGAEHVLLCLGDSLTAGYGLDEDQAWPALLQARLDRDLPGWRVVNAGASGDTSADGLGRLDWLLRSRPDAAFVCLGANDGLRGLAPDVTARNLDAVLARLKRGGTQVALAGMDLPTNLGPGYRAAFKAIFPRAARRAGVPFLPFLLADVAGLATLNQADGVHPNAAGQAIVARNVAAFLEPLLRRAGRGSRADAGGARARVLRSRDDLEESR